MTHLTRTQIRELLDRHDLAPSRALGQNFLCDPSMVDKIVRLAAVRPGDRVVEIGPGLGSLTLGLATAGASVLAVEIDRYLVPVLAEVVAGLDVDIRNADAMTLDWDAELGDDTWAVVANLPYNVATPLILDLLVAQPQLQRWVVMVQREVGERLAAEPGDKACGIPSAMVAYFGTASVVGNVPPQLFLPQPKVESVLVRIDRSPTPRVDAPFERFNELVRAGFGQRRKMLRRSLAPLLDVDQIVEAGVEPTARPEELTLEQWGALARLG
ncbi:MAG: 16S rRNA (adenine(1518)-N(6)/adenine(1519)-N(6))-dimethyltransferase RsmA [Acidimicrobiales bacterium]